MKDISNAGNVHEEHIAAYEQRLRSLRTFRGYTEDEAELAAWAADEIDRLREKLNRPGEYDLFDPKEAS